MILNNVIGFISRGMKNEKILTIIKGQEFKLSLKMTVNILITLRNLRSTLRKNGFRRIVSW